MSKTQIYVGVNITANELTEKLFLENKLPKNYEMRTYDRKGFETMLKMSKPIVVKSYNIKGKCDFNTYLRTEKGDDVVFITIVKVRTQNQKKEEFFGQSSQVYAK